VRGLTKRGDVDGRVSVEQVPRLILCSKVRGLS